MRLERSLQILIMMSRQLKKISFKLHFAKQAKLWTSSCRIRPLNRQMCPNISSIQLQDNQYLATIMLELRRTLKAKVERIQNTQLENNITWDIEMN